MGHYLADSLENWKRLWKENPALLHGQIERPIGWVLEAAGVIVGYLGTSRRNAATATGR